MRFAAPLVPARFLTRQRRFLAQVEFLDGRREWVHVPNSGALTGCNFPGQEILLTREDKPGRKTAFTWRFLATPSGWICIDTLVPNLVVAEALAAGCLPGLPPLRRFRSEVTTLLGSRLDFVVDLGGKLVFIEVKSVTWVEDGVALFPDGVTSRGRRHLEHLGALVRQGHEAWQLFVVQHPEARVLKPAAAVDPAYARELAAAAACGVKIVVLQEKISPPEISLATSLPFDLT